MASIDIMFKRQVSVDLNAYYPNFTPALRRSIEDELFKLLGGQPSPKSAVKRPKSTGKYVGKARLTTKPFPRTGSRSLIILNAMKEEYGGRQFELDEARVLIALTCEKHKFEGGASYLANFIGQGFVELVKP